MSIVQDFIARITGKPKAEDIEVTCPDCGKSFSVDVDNDKDNESWRTDDEAGEVGESDPEDGDYEDSMHTPKERSDRMSDLTKAILNVAKDRDSVGAEAHEISPKQSVEIVANTKKIVENSPADLLAVALKREAKSRR